MRPSSVLLMACVDVVSTTRVMNDLYGNTPSAHWLPPSTPRLLQRSDALEVRAAIAHSKIAAAHTGPPNSAKILAAGGKQTKISDAKPQRIVSPTSKATEPIPSNKARLISSAENPKTKASLASNDGNLAKPPHIGAQNRLPPSAGSNGSRASRDSKIKSGQPTRTLAKSGTGLRSGIPPGLKSSGISRARSAANSTACKARSRLQRRSWASFSASCMMYAGAAFAGGGLWGLNLGKGETDEVATVAPSVSSGPSPAPSISGSVPVPAPGLFTTKVVSVTCIFIGGCLGAAGYFLNKKDSKRTERQNRIANDIRDERLRRIEMTQMTQHLAAAEEGHGPMVDGGHIAPVAAQAGGAVPVPVPAVDNPLLLSSGQAPVPVAATGLSPSGNTARSPTNGNNQIPAVSNTRAQPAAVSQNIPQEGQGSVSRSSSGSTNYYSPSE